MKSRNALLVVAAVVACAAAVTLWLRAHRVPEIDLASPVIVDAGALDRASRPDKPVVAERFRRSFQTTQHWASLTEEQREKLLDQVSSYLHAMLGDAMVEVPPLMAAWGGRPGPRMTPERVEAMWSEPGRNFPWTRFNPDQSRLSAVGTITYDGQQAIDIPRHPSCSHHSMGTFFEFGEEPLLRDRVTAMVALPVASAETDFTVHLIYAWSVPKRTWIPVMLYLVTAAKDRGRYSPIMF